MDFAPENIKKDSVVAELARFVCSLTTRWAPSSFPIDFRSDRDQSLGHVAYPGGEAAQLVAGCKQIKLASRLLHRF